MFREGESKCFKHPAVVCKFIQLHITATFYAIFTAIVVGSLQKVPLTYDANQGLWILHRDLPVSIQVKKTDTIVFVSGTHS